MVWLQHLKKVLTEGATTEVRGKRMVEIPQATIKVDMRKPVVAVSERKLNYKFMAAEAYWILSGDDSVAGIAPWNAKIAEYSDDGVRFFGAYGPPIKEQMAYVVGKLKADPASRQAGLTIWRQNPPETKDYPCTVAMFFSIRAGQLHAHVFMRSSDAWLGLPYDIFNFSCIAAYVLASLNDGAATHDMLFLGNLYLTMANAHIYETDLWKAIRVVGQDHRSTVLPLDDMRMAGMLLPPQWTVKPEALMDGLRETRGRGLGALQ
ncbi:hypothetical protein KGP36_02495 [Patescibacteria group bacterium]|nr:hypothetical protein [Patescibacteria group bacterium]